MPGTLRTGTLALAACVAVAGALPADAQTSTGSLPLERWRSAGDNTGLGTTEGGGIPDHLEVQAGYVANVSVNPLLIIRNGEDGTQRDGHPVAFRLHGEVLATFGLFDYFAFGVNVPHVPYQAQYLGEGGTTDVPLDDHFSFIGLGDLRLTPKVRLLREDKHFVSLSLMPTFTLPTAFGFGLSEQLVDYGESYLGEGPLIFGFQPEAALSTNFFGVRLAGNLAWRLRPTRQFLGFIPVGSDITTRFGGGYDFMWLWNDLKTRFDIDVEFPTESLIVYAEVFGSTADRDPFGIVTYTTGQLGRDPNRPADDPLTIDETVALARTRLQTHAEVSAGVRWNIAYGIQVEAGIAAPLLSGYGTPDFRGYGGVRWAYERRDRDGDGIEDRKDACPDEPEDKDGIADSDGCPDLDNDGDGFADVVDRCRDEPEDFDGFLDEDGCPEFDNDEDGIPDNDDRCPDQKGPATTGGCPIIDTDKDGLPDEVDRCPEQMGPLEREGCPIVDTDEDGLMDEQDLCPEEKGPIDRKGCPLKDRDSDGIEDADDSCPDDPGPVERDGCPVNDTDLDGLLDELDKCPKDKGPKANNGCPYPDSDGDGVVDDIDECKDVAGPVIFKGCPDTDGDGVEDREDTCKDEAGLKIFQGCNDRDADGVPDFADKCPDKPEVINGIDDEDGCPDEGKQIVIVTKQAIEIRERVYFNFGKASVQDRSFDLLTQVARVLKANPQITRIEVQGHTDSRGNADYNRRLSQRRAEAVVAYLIGPGGLQAQRVVAKGYGEDVPLTDNDTEDSRAQNRRVEFVILNQAGGSKDADSARGEGAPVDAAPTHFPPVDAAGAEGTSNPATSEGATGGSGEPPADVPSEGATTP